MQKAEAANTRYINWPTGIFLVVSPFIAAFGIYHWINTGSFNWATIILAVILFSIVELSITAGYHRLFAHRTYNAKWPVRLFFLIFGAAAFQNSALLWSLDHRDHHNYVDDNDKDPYSINKGFFWAHMGWLLFKNDYQLANCNKSGDLTNDPLVMWQHRYWFPAGTLAGYVLPMVIAMAWGDWFGGLMLAGFARAVFNHQCTFLINSLAHYIGKQTYSDSHSARDNWFAAFLTFGEGYHNYHHEFSSDYRNGVRIYDWDPTKWLIKGLSLFGLTYNLKTIREEIIVRKRMQMEEKRLHRKLAKKKDFEFHGTLNFKTLTRLKERIENAFKVLSRLRDEHKDLLKSSDQTCAFIKLEIKDLTEQINKARDDFMDAVQQWTVMSNRVLKLAYARV